MALQHGDVDRGLVVLDGREHGRCRGRGRGVLLDQVVEVANDDHDAERVRRDVEQEDLALLVGERRALDRRKPERIDFTGRTDDNHNGADQAMAVDLLAALEGRATFPVPPRDPPDAGPTGMAVTPEMGAGTGACGAPRCDGRAGGRVPTPCEACGTASGMAWARRACAAL